MEYQLEYTPQEPPPVEKIVLTLTPQEFHDILVMVDHGCSDPWGAMPVINTTRTWKMDVTRAAGTSTFDRMRVRAELARIKEQARL